MGKLVLIVDDDPDNVSYLKDVLEDAGYRTVTAGDGLEGMERVRQACPDLVLLDLMMPNKSGIRMFQELKADQELRRIPVVIVTGVSQATGVDFSHLLVRQAAGQPEVSPSGETKYSRPSGFLEKPVEPEELLRVVQEVLKSGQV
jgi:two-component system cell cycle response regulator DivK